MFFIEVPCHQKDHEWSKMYDKARQCDIQVENGQEQCQNQQADRHFLVTFVMDFYQGITHCIFLLLTHPSPAVYGVAVRCIVGHYRTVALTLPIFI